MRLHRPGGSEGYTGATEVQVAKDDFVQKGREVRTAKTNFAFGGIELQT